jgi:hypothetical protein
LGRHVLPAGAQQPLAPDVFAANMHMPDLAANLIAQQGHPVPNVLTANLAAGGQQGPAAPAPVIVPQVQPVVAVRDLPAGYLPIIETQARCRKIDLKNMDAECPKCGALHWACERLSKSTIASPKFGTCCLDGKVKIPALKNPPRDLLELYNGTNPHSKHFLTHITSYNNAFAMVSLSHNAVRLPGGPQSFIITGELKHMSGSLLPEPGKTPVYAQVYFQSDEQALDLRIQRANQISDGNGAKRAVMQIIQDVLHRYNQYIALYKTARERIDEAGDIPDVHVRLHFAAGSDQRRYNLPTAEEVAIILPGDGAQPADHRDIIIQMRAGPLKRIMETNPAYQALYYVLLFPKGEHGWHRDIPLNVENGQNLHIADEDEQREPGAEPNGDDGNPDLAGVGVQRKRSNVSQLEYYAYRLHQRRNESDHLFRAQGLFQRYIVDAWAQTDQARLAWLKYNQDKLRVDIYKGIVDAVAAHADADLGELGQRFILPSSYIGSSRNMFQLYQDSLALARFFSKPDFFLTITANPNWEEITRELLPGQKPKDRPDLIARVFREKVRIILEKIKSGILEKHVGHVYTIEFQKRGLPHVHILIFLAPESRIHEPAMLDKVISAQIPDPETHPRLHALVTKMMVHNPCGEANPTSPCMKNGKCSKGYPKKFVEETSLAHDGYAIYARPNNGRTFTTADRKVIDNTWIVPYSPLLILLLECHANLECCISVKAFKYIHKYVYKGHDRTTMGFGETQDEIKLYLDSRYVSASEATWRLMRFKMHEETPNVVRLAVHLKDEQTVIFNEEDNANVVVDAAAARHTTLTAYFKANAEELQRRQNAQLIGPYPPSALDYLYQEFPQKFTWDLKKRVWKPRKQGFAIGRMYFAHPSAGERFYLRTLLTVVRGSPSFESLRTYNGEIHPTFKAACMARGLLEDDSEWKQCLEEASVMQTGRQLRQLFVTILKDCIPSEPLVLWDQFKEHICDDLAYALRNKGFENPTPDQVYDYGLYLIEKSLREVGKSLKDFPPMLMPVGNWAAMEGNQLIADQLAYDRAEQREKAEENIQKMNLEQRQAFDAIIHSVSNNPQMFFLHGPAGTGKTFCYKTMCFQLRGQGKIVLCVASSGIASLLLPGGRTAHSTFKIPIQLHDGKTCSVKKGTDLAALICNVDLIIWDEVPMQNRLCQEAVDLTFKDIRNNDQPFGGVAVVFGGDFQQILPVVIKGTREEIVGQCLQRSRLWSDIKVLKLKENMRLENSTQEEKDFAQWLLDVGHGRGLNADGHLPLPDHMKCGDSVNDLLNAIYPGITVLDPRENNDQYFLERTVLNARNDDVDELNEQVLQRLGGDEKIFDGADSVVTERGVDGDVQYPVEYLNTINVSGLPLAKLKLKIGAPIMILRNIDPSQGLCNGTRAILTRASGRVLEVRIIGGDHAGKKAFIPRITISTSNSDLPFELRRRQFPVRLAFAMTINKSQGQSVKHIGLDLRRSIFTHGQLYVALSRCTSSLRIKVLIESKDFFSTPNIVFPEVLL